MWRLLSHLVLLATASASLVISEVADKGGVGGACDGGAVNASECSFTAEGKGT